MKEKNPGALKYMQKVQRGMNRWRERIGDPEFNHQDFQVEEVDVVIPSLDPVYDGYRLANISDIHLGQWITAKHLKGVINLVNNEKPDSVTITGDFVSYILDDFAEDLESALNQLKPREKTFAVLGNHDHWLGPEKIRKILYECDIIDVSNDVSTLHRENALLHIAGVDSVMLEKHRLDLVMEKLPEEGPAILLAHEPDFADVSSTTGRFSLQISGHSHGGQFLIPGIGTFIRGPHFVKYPVGKYQVGNMVQYTSRGLGTNVFWFRINCPPEITMFTLKCPEDNDGGI
ncbi:MAG TPA: metallophosphoesterase [Methanobacteriaceae archaeon]|nr:metallophosphoesterase [Methanobacteriaceae archaeon]